MAARLSLKKVAVNELHLSRLPADTQKAFKYCTTLSLLKNSPWYLAGGTALALQVGHRQSVDLDFFSPQTNFRERLVERKLLATNKWSTTFQEEGTLYGKFLNAKVSFIAYPFFRPSKKFLQCGHVRLLLPKDIAAMKIIAISQRGRKRDFVDLYWYCKNVDYLSEVLHRAVAQYPNQEHNMSHFIKSLTYFEDAEADPMPEVFFEVTWEQVKRYFKHEVPKLANKLIY